MNTPPYPPSQQSATRQALLAQLGFRFGINGPHAARTMMLDDIRRLLEHTIASADTADYAQAIKTQNVLGKPSQKARDLAWRHLHGLYGLSHDNPLFRLMRTLWPLSDAAQPQLALAMAMARDPLLRDTQALILDRAIGTSLPRTALEHELAHRYPDRFSTASLKSFAQNIAGTWTAAGFLLGHTRKHRAQPALTPEALVLLLLMAYLEGRSGPRLFTSLWLAPYQVGPDALAALAQTASQRGLLVFMNAGGVQEIRFPGALTPAEDAIRQELIHVL